MVSWILKSSCASSGPGRESISSNWDWNHKPRTNWNHFSLNSLCLDTCNFLPLLFLGTSLLVLTQLEKDGPVPAVGRRPFSVHLSLSKAWVSTVQSFWQPETSEETLPRSIGPGRGPQSVGSRAVSSCCCCCYFSFCATNTCDILKFETVSWVTALWRMELPSGLSLCEYSLIRLVVKCIQKSQRCLELCLSRIRFPHCLYCMLRLTTSRKQIAELGISLTNDATG